MKAGSRVLAAASSLTLALLITGVAFAQKTGGILKISHFDSPGEHVAPRGVDRCGAAAGHGGIQ
jgi:hypothetical protein